MEKKAHTREISLKVLWSIFIKRLWIMAVAALVAVVASLIVFKVTYVPVYQSTATIYVLHSDSSDTSNSNDYMLAFHLVKDCEFMIKSHSVLDETIKDLNLETNYTNLKKAVVVTNPKDTRVVEITVNASTPELAQKIANKIKEKSITHINEVMGARQVNDHEDGRINEMATNKKGFSTYLLIGVIAAVIAYIVFLILYVADDRISSEEDVKKYFDLSVLCVIPNMDEIKKGKYGYKKSYYYKHHYGYYGVPEGYSKDKQNGNEAMNKDLSTTNSKQNHNINKENK